jgi:hypothetical protein
MAKDQEEGRSGPAAAFDAIIVSDSTKGGFVMRYMKILLAAAAVFALLSLAFADDGGIKEKLFVATVGPDGVQHVAITGGEYFFDPNHVVVKANVPVELSLKKEKGYVPHDIMVKAPEAGIDFAVDLKETPQAVRFTPTKPGKYEMLCGKKLLFFKSHKDRGMHGMIEVIP